MQTSLVAQAALNRRRTLSHSGPQQLVENRTIYERHGVDLSIYDTFAQADRVLLSSQEVLYCGMISGKKILHGKQRFHSAFLPHESFVMAPGESVAIDFPDATLDNPTSCLTLGFSRDRLRLVCDQLNQLSPRPKEQGEWRPQHDHVLHLLHTEATQQLLIRIVDSFLNHDSDRDVVLDLGVTELLTRMLRQQGRQFLLQCARQNPTLNGVTEVVRFIDDHLADAMDIEQLCRIACMSRSKFYEQFRQIVGVGPMEYIQQRRLERARELIASGESITRACYQVGYQSLSHFSRRFHQLYGMPPSTYATSRHAR